MTLSRLPRHLRALAYLVAVAVIVWLSLKPGGGAPGYPFADKVHHFAAYAALTAYGLILFPRRPRLLLAAVLGLGAVLEFAQGAMGLGRSGDWRDMAANAAGVAAAFATAAFLRRRAEAAG